MKRRALAGLHLAFLPIVVLLFLAAGTVAVAALLLPALAADARDELAILRGRR